MKSRSDVFHAMFNNPQMEEAKTGRVVLEKMRLEVVKTMINYIYTGKVDSANVTIAELIEAAEIYHLRALKEWCISQLMCKVNEKNAVDVMIVADMYRIDELKEATKKIIMQKGITFLDVTMLTRSGHFCYDNSIIAFLYLKYKCTLDYR